MKYIFIIILVFSALIFSSCSDHVKEIQCSRIDSLYNISDDFQNKLNEFHEDSIANYYSTIQSFNKVLVEKLHGLPESEEMKDKLLQIMSSCIWTFLHNALKNPFCKKSFLQHSKYLPNSFAYTHKFLCYFPAVLSQLEPSSRS